MKARWPITMMYEVLEVSPSGYFSWEAAGRRADTGARRRHGDEALLAHIRAIYEQLRGGTAGQGRTRNCWPVGFGWAMSGCAC